MRLLLALLLVGLSSAARADAVIPGDHVKPQPPAKKLHDSDGDGIPDVDDLCPNEAEDRDGFEDEDGCPDPDNDHDRILDKDDKCPNDPETYNGIEDEDGCPDKCVLKVRPMPFLILDKIYFPSGSTEPPPVARPILDALAASLKGNPAIRRVEIQGYTDERERAQLGEARAAAVRAFLIARGVAAERTVARGYGATRPSANQHSAAGREKNRRVEFQILEQDADK